MLPRTGKTGSSIRTRATFSGLLIGFVLAGAGPGAAASLVYEPFSYGAGTVLEGVAATGQNLSGDYVALGPSAFQQLVVESPGLGYGNLMGAPSASGNRVSDAAGATTAGATVSLSQDVTVNSGDAIYWSTLFTLDDSANRNHLANVTLMDETTGDQLFFGEPGVGIGGVRVSASTMATGGVLADGADNAFVDGATLFLIGRYFNSAATGADTLDLIGYDTADAAVLPATFDPTDPNAEFAFGLSNLDIDLVQVTSVMFTIRGTDNNFIDELRIGSTYADVVPEPTTASLMMLGLAGMAALARVRRPRP